MSARERREREERERYIYRTSISVQVEKSDGPVYSNEEGLAYVRTVAGNQCLTLDRLMVRLRTGKSSDQVSRLNRILSPLPFETSTNTEAEQ